MATSAKKAAKRAATAERARRQAARPSLFQTHPNAVNRSATRIPLLPQTGTRATRRTAAVSDEW